MARRLPPADSCVLNGKSVDTTVRTLFVGGKADRKVDHSSPQARMPSHWEGSPARRGMTVVTTPPLPLSDSGKRLRLSRLVPNPDAGVLVVPLDHSVASGPFAETDDLASIVQAVAAHGGDGVVLHKGRVRFIDPTCFRQLALIVHLNGSTEHAPDADAKTMLAGVEDALALGADAVSVQVNLGSDTEAQQLSDLGAVAQASRRWSMPLLAMMYPRGPRIDEPTRPDLIAHAASLAADLGADLVKTPYTGSVASMAAVVRSCPIPVIVAGGEVCASEHELLAVVEEIMSCGVKGLAMGRNIFQANDVARTVRGIAEIIHTRTTDRRAESAPQSSGWPVGSRLAREPSSL